MSPEAIDLKKPCDHSMENNEWRHGSHRQHKEAPAEDSHGRHPGLPEAVTHCGGSITDVVDRRRTAKTRGKAEDWQKNTREEWPIEGGEPTHKPKRDESENDRMNETESMKNGISQE